MALPTNQMGNDSSPKTTTISAQIRQTVSPELVLQEYLDVINRRKWSIAAVFLAVVLLGTAYTYTRKRQYEASTKLAVVTRQGLEGASAGLASTLGGGSLTGLIQPRNVLTQVEIVNSPDMLEAAFNKLTPDEKRIGYRGNALPIWGTTIENKPDTDIIQITVTSYNPQVSAKLANLIAQTYLDKDLENNTGSTKKAEEYVSKSLDQVQAELSDAEARIAAFKKDKNFLSTDVLTLAEQALMNKMGIMDDAASQWATSVSKAAALGAEVKRQSPTIKASSTVEQNPIYALIAQGVSDLQRKRVDTLQESTPESPEIQKIDESIAAEKERLANTAKDIITQTVNSENPVRDTLLASYAAELANQTAMKTQFDVAKKQYEDMLPQLAEYPEKEKDLTDLSQKEEALITTTTMLSERLYNLRIQEQSNLPNGSIASFAHAPLLASYPKMVLSTFMVILLAVVISAAAAALLERFDSRIHDPMRLDQLTGLTTMTAVPEIEVTNSVERPLIGAGHDSQAFLESYRILRNNIAFSSPDRECRTVAVTSAGQGEGKSTTAINLAISMGMDGKRALIIDVDLRRPSIHTALGLPRDVGFTSVVTGKKTLEEAVQKTSFENVDCLAAGPLPPNPTEFLNSLQSREVIFKAAELYDVVIMDCPPTTGLSDVQVISTFVDGMLLVVGLEITRFPQLRATMQTLWQANAPMLGVVINRIAPNRPGYGYYYSYYTYYGSDDGSSGKAGVRRRKKKKGTY